MSSQSSGAFLVVSYQPENAPLALLQIADTLTDSTTIRFLATDNFNEHHELIFFAGKSILILVLTKKEDLIGVLNLLSKFQSQIKTGLIKVFVFNLTDNPKVTGLLKTKDCRDFLEYSISDKALLQKMHQAILAIEKTIPGFLISTPPMATINKSPPRIVHSEIDPTKMVHWTEPVAVKSDCWLLTNDRDAKNIQGKWLIEMLGPGPSVGSWLPTVPGESTSWDWTPRDLQNDPFIVEQGKWTFQGRQPEFNWKKSRWQFVSSTPALGFYYRGQSYGDRFSVDPESNLNFARNSQQAHAKLPLILAGLEPEIRVSPGSPIEIPTVLIEKSQLGNTLSTEIVVEHEWATGAQAFESMDLSVKMKALNQVLGDWSKVHLLENRAQDILIEAPRGSLKVGQDVSFQITANDGPKPVSFEVSGMVSKTEIFDNDSMFVSIEFEQGNRSLLQNVADMVEKRQTEIVEFLKQAKGI